MKRTLAAVCLVVIVAAPIVAQDVTGGASHTVAVGAHYQRFSFGPNSDIERAGLLLIPFTFQSRMSPRTALDGYSAYASGSITSSGKYYTLDGPVDSWIRLRWAANSWAVVAIGVALPTGVASHTGAEAAVSNALANDLLGFREATWGGAASGTFGISTAHRIGSTRLTMGSSYRLAGSFQPSVDTAMRYAPGDEARFRVGIERQAGQGAFAAGFTAQHFAIDKADQRNLFQSGNRLRGDLSYSSPNWGVYASNLWRAQGDLNIPVVNALDGRALRDTVVTVGWQNLMIAGASYAMQPGGSMKIIFSEDFKVRRRHDAGGDGWLATEGIVIPMRLGAAEIFPNAKVTHGRIMSSVNTTFAQKVKGLEIGMVVRRAFLRH